MSQIAGRHHVMSVMRNFQDTNTPDIDLDRDVIVAGGALVANQNRRYKFNFATIIMSAIVFLAILAWFDFIQTAFYTWLEPDTQSSNPSPTNKLWYALLITVFVGCCCGLLIIYSNPLST